MTRSRTQMWSGPKAAVYRYSLLWLSGIASLPHQLTYRVYYDPVICSGLTSSVLTTHVVDPISSNTMTLTPFTVPMQHGVSWVRLCSNLCCASGLIAPATIGISTHNLIPLLCKCSHFPCLGTLFYKASCIAAAICMPPCLNDGHSLLRCPVALQLKLEMRGKA